LEDDTMRRAPAVELNPEQKTALERLARQRSLPARLVERARIVLLAANGLENQQIATALRMTPEKVSRWRKRFLQGGIAALEKDAPRPGRTRTITAPKVKRVVRMTLEQTPGQRHPLEHPDHGAGSGNQRGQRAPHLARSWTEAASGENFQTQPRSRVR
jgi:hypothetical protein